MCARVPALALVGACGAPVAVLVAQRLACCGASQVAPDALDPENSGKELEALSAQAGDLAKLLKALIGDIKALEERVDVLMPAED